MNYTHLIQSERYQISDLLGSGKSIGDIAKQLGRNKSILYREVRRNKGLLDIVLTRPMKKLLTVFKILIDIIKITQKVINKIAPAI